MSALYRTPPLVLNPELAAQIGLNEAIVVQQLHYWLERSKNKHKGHRWVYNTISEWREQFPFWSAATVKRTLAALRERGIIIVEQGVARRADRTNWYRLDYAKLPASAWDQNEPMVGSDCAVPSAQSAPISNRTETSQESSTNGARTTEPMGFEEWLEHHSSLTGQSVPRLSKARAELARKYGELVGEGRSAEDMKLASVGAHADQWRRENGKDYPRNVLVFATIDELIDRGRKAAREKATTGERRFVRRGPRRAI
jgi:hypothetical protein